MAIEESLSLPDRGLQPAVPKRRPAQRFPAAIFVSVLAHCVLVALAMWSVSSEVLHIPAGPSGGGGGAVTVTLVSASAVGAGGHTGGLQTHANVSAELDSVFEKFRSPDQTSGRDQNRGPRGDPAQLFKELDDARRKASGMQTPKTSSDGHSDADGVDLWARIRPCWRRPSGVVVTLDMGVDSEGRLAWAPRPIRESQSPPGARELLAESMAVQAAVRCAPFREVAPIVGAKTFRIVFAG